MMRSVGRRRLGILTHTLVGTVLGAIAAFWIGRAILLRSAKTVLSDYAQVLAEHAGELSGELKTTFHQLNASVFPYCSDHQLAELQAQTFHSQAIKDIGRSRQGLLDCSAFLGRLKHPFVVGGPTLILADKTVVYTSVPVSVDAADGAHATIFQSGGVGIVLSPDAFNHWIRPHVRYMIVAINRVTGEIAPIAGASLKAEPAWVLSQGSRVVDGAMYRSRCSPSEPVCAITTESLADIWAWSRTTQTAYTVMGGLAGFGLGFAVGLLYLRTISLSGQLHRALQKSSPSLRLVYEPILDMETGRCTGAEVLLRWSDQDGVAVAPEIFVRMAEDRDLSENLPPLSSRTPPGN